MFQSSSLGTGEFKEEGSFLNSGIITVIKKAGGINSEGGHAQSRERARKTQRVKRSRGKHTQTHRAFCSTAHPNQPALNAAHVPQINAEPSLVPGLPARAQGLGEANSTGAVLSAGVCTIAARSRAWPAAWKAEQELQGGHNSGVLVLSDVMR